MHKLYLNEFKIIPIYTVGIYRRSIHIKCEAVLNFRLCRYAVIFNVIYGRERFPVERKKKHLSLNIVVIRMSHGVNLCCCCCHRCHCWVTVRTNFNAMRLHIKRHHINNFIGMINVRGTIFIPFCNLNTNKKR